MTTCLDTVTHRDCVRSALPKLTIAPLLSRRNVANIAGVCGEEKTWCDEEKLYFGATVDIIVFMGPLSLFT